MEKRNIVCFLGSKRDLIEAKIDADVLSVMSKQGFGVSVKAIKIFISFLFDDNLMSVEDLNS